MEKRLDKVFRENLIRDDVFGELRPHSLLVEVVSGKLAPRGRALNLECGQGSDSLYLAQEGYAVASVGFFPGDIAEVKRHAEEARADVATFIATPERLPFHEGEFDFIADAGCVIGLGERERSALIGELHRMLRRGGRMFTMLPSYRDERGGATRSTIEEMFHPPFEVIRVIESAVTEAGGKAEHLFYCSVLLEKV